MTNELHQSLPSQSKGELPRNSSISENALLPPDFQPTPFSIIVGRGKEADENPGNKWLAALVMPYLDQYAQDDKRIKSNLVSNLVTFVNTHEGGGFIKRTARKNGGRWYHVDTSEARRRVGFVFRDLLAEKYRSSLLSKAVSRRKMQLIRVQRSLSDESTSYQRHQVLHGRDHQDKEVELGHLQSRAAINQNEDRVPMPPTVSAFRPVDGTGTQRAPQLTLNHRRNSLGCFRHAASDGCLDAVESTDQSVIDTEKLLNLPLLDLELDHQNNRC